MAYIGNTATTQAFTPAIDYFSGNGSTTAFTLSRTVASTAQVQAVIENVPQNPGSAFTVSGNTITFTSAPPSGTNNIYVYYVSLISQVDALPQSPQVFGSMTFSSSGARIYGDYTNATVTNRLSFQTTTANSSTGIYALPNGTSTAASWQATNNSDPTNASKVLIATNGSTDVQLVSGRNGTGTYLPLTFYTNGSEQMRLDTSGNLGLGVTPSGNSRLEVSSGGLARNGVQAWYGSGANNPIAFAVNNANGDGYLGFNTVQAAGSDNQTYFASSYAAKIRANPGTGGMQFYTAPSGTAGNAISFTQALTLNNNGVLALQGGNTSATGVGIAFPATQSASSDANTLDDYEEGTWTPVCAATGQTISYAGRAGTYTKIGDTVRAECAIVLSTVSGTSTSNTTITGLPFANGGASYTGLGIIGYNDGFASTLYSSWLSSTTAYFRSGTRSSGNDSGGFTTGGYINVVWVYKV